MRLRTSGRVRRLTADEILRVETPHSELHQQGAAHFAAGRYAEAVVALEAAARAEVRDWVRRDILATLNRVHLRAGRRLEAARAFVRLTDSDPATHHFPDIPLWWQTGPADEPAHRQALLWLDGPNRSARLIAASILLGTEDSDVAARGVLEDLATSGDGQFVNLSRAQQWRTRLRQERPPSDVEMRVWRLRLRSMKSAERAGPWFLLGRAHSRRHEHGDAAIAWLWLPLVYPTDHWLAAEASFRAAEALQEFGRPAESRSMLHETAKRFAGTPAAARARAALGLPPAAEQAGAAD